MKWSGRQYRWMTLLLIAIIALVWIPAANSLLAIRLLFSLSRLASGDAGVNLPVEQSTIRQQLGIQTLEALSYQPKQSSPKSAVILIPGISELGCYHPRLMALARFLASQGFLVITPDIRKFREFKIAPEAMDEIALWTRHALESEGGLQHRRVALAGISFSGTLALMTAARPEFLDRLAFVLAIGPYDDPLRCSRQWFEADPEDAKKNYYPTRFYAKWIIMLAALDMLSLEAERRFINDVLVDLLLQKEVAKAPPWLSVEGNRWYRLAVMRGEQSDPELSGKMEQHLTPILYQRIMPDGVLANLRCPVFLVHGAFDDLIPPDESVRLQKRLRGSKSYLVISPFITHTHPWDKPLSIRQKTAAILDLALFFYRLAAVAR